jgi:F-type H+-transporting ATPase subunit alpha
MSVPEQIITLLALTSGLFDNIPIDKIQEAETNLLKACAELPSEMLKEIFSDKELSKENNEAILKLSSNVLIPFQEKTKQA